MSLQRSVSSVICPHNTQLCYTLSHLAENPMNYFPSNTRIIFLPGNHTSDSNRSIVIANVSNITLEGSGSTIQCIKDIELGFVFIRVTNLSITNLHLYHCGAVLPSEVELEIYKITTLSKLLDEYAAISYTKSSPALYLIQVTNITISRVCIYNSTGPGLLGLNVIGHSTISQSSFVRNNPNCALLFMDTASFTPGLQSVELSIFDSNFLFCISINTGTRPTNKYNLKEYNRSFFTTGLRANTRQMSYKVSLNISNVTVHANNFGNLFFCTNSLNRNSVTILLHNVNCSHSNYTGLALQIHSDNIVYFPSPSKPLKSYTVTISQSHFGHNSHAVVIWRWNIYTRRFGSLTFVNTTFYSNSLALTLKLTDAILNSVSFIYNTAEIDNAPIQLHSSLVRFQGNAIFLRNRGETAGAIYADESQLYFQGMDDSNASIQIHDSVVGNATFLRNRGETAGAIYAHRSHLFFQGRYDSNAPIQIQDRIVDNATFLRNSGEKAGAIYAHRSQLYFQGNVQFVENEAHYGGAIALYEWSKITTRYSISNYKVTFTRNYARYCGGAIYIDKIKSTSQLDCVYYPAPTWLTLMANEQNKNKTAVMVFTNNTSGVAGSAIYGWWVKLCNYPPRNTFFPGYVYFKLLFEINTNSSDLSPVSSEPVRVCICFDSKPVCNITYHTVTVYPGQTFQMSAVGVGQMYGTVPSIIHAQFYQTNSTMQPNIERLQQVQKVEKFCSQLSYTVKSANTAEDIILTVQSNISKEVLANLNWSNPFPKSIISLEKQFYNLVIHVDLQTCPLGSIIINKTTCVCHPQLLTLGIQCNITTGRIYKDVRVWVNATFHEGVQTGVIVHQNHPFDYCKPHSLNLSLENPDEQCAFHRSGVLCGACQHNLSHVLGSSNCKQCSSLWSILFIPTFAIAGIVLVVFLMILNLTVSVGTINGLIFYANIVRANQAVFFPHNINKSLLSWFIAWMNLDLGFEVCFYNGMDAYAKTWLQFIFPIYIWFIVILIIVSSHYYTTAAKISGRNAVQALATLLLLSYAKLLRLTITIFSSTTLEYPDGSVRRVWLYDGNVDYLKGKHIPLFMAALLVLLVLSLPYTALLLFIQCLQQKSKHRVLFWIGKFKPLFDAYTGPYKDKHRYWTGLLLLVRTILFLIFSVNVFGDPAINLFATATMMSLLLIYVAISKHVYRVKYLNMLEYSSFLNLGITSTALLFTRLTTENQTALTYTSVGIAFVTFCVIVLYHTVIRIKELCQQNHYFQQITNDIKQRINSHKRNQNQETHQPGHTTHPPGNPQVPITFIELREPLLEYCGNN